MKRFILTLAVALSAITAQAQTKTVKKDSIPLFYGLTADKILSLSVPEGKALIKEKGITVSDYFTAKLTAENYLLDQKIKRDSLRLIQIYDRIEKKLSMKKNDGKTKG